MRTIAIATLGLCLAACAEQQAAAPTPLSDDSLTCSAIVKEQEANAKALRVVDDPYLAATNFTRATPFMEAQTKAPALQSRQQVLATLAAKRGC